MSRLGWLVLVLVVGCASSAPAAPARNAIAKPSSQIAAPEPSEPADGARVRGLTGTLNRDDVHQTMDARRPEFDSCISKVRRRHRFVSGSIRFAFWVDGEGLVERVRPTESDVGHYELERCLTDVVRATEFPRPAGRATARFDWDMHVDSAYGGAPEALDPKLVRKLLRKRARDVFRDCKVRRFRHRFKMTAYVSHRGQVLSVGAVPTRPLDEEKLGCVLEAVKDWRLPRQKHRSKVSFLLR